MIQIGSESYKIVQTRSLLYQIVNTCFTGRLLLDTSDNYTLEAYGNVSEMVLPTIEDFQELVQYCRCVFNETSRSKEVTIVGPSGERIQIDTKNHLNRPENPNSHIRIRQGENVPTGTNMFWLKSDIKDNQTNVWVIDTNNKTLYVSTHYIGYKLPYLLVRKTK